MHGAGNDYIYVDTHLNEVMNPAAAAVKLSQYHTGIGADGLVLIQQLCSSEADFSMRIFNADGVKHACVAMHPGVSENMYMKKV